MSKKIKPTPEFLSNYIRKLKNKYDDLPKEYIEELKPNLAKAAKDSLSMLGKPNTEMERYSNLVAFYLTVEVLNAKYGITLDD